MTEIDQGIESVRQLSRSVLHQFRTTQPSSLDGLTSDSRRIRIRMADAFFKTDDLNSLLSRRYRARGYDAPRISSEYSSPEFITLAAEAFDESVIGTVSLRIDGPQRLMCDETYGDIVGMHRVDNARLCEFGKLALDLPEGEIMLSRYVMGALVDIAYIYARNIYECSSAFIEVNPRHVAFYTRCLGFVKVGEERVCTRANAPAVLMKVPFDHVDRQVDLFCGQGPDSKSRSLYPFFFSKQEREGITRRLKEAMGALSS